MGIQSGTEKRAALAYAASQGWRSPEEVAVLTELHAAVSDPTNITAEAEARNRAQAERIADLEVALETERESHETTKRVLLRTRGKGSAGLRIQALEKALAKLTGDDVTEDDLDAAKALLK